MTKVFFWQGFSRPNQPTDGHNRSTRFQDGQASASRERNARKQGNKKAGDQKKQSHTLIKPPAAGGDWQAVDDGTGKTYYYNGKTGVSQWEKPPGM
jgi:hypothetical protein